MNSFLLALQFLTVIPLKIKHLRERELANALVFFPLIGLLLGLFLSLINELFLLLNFSPLSIQIILVLSLASLSGGMHLDGLCDTADAIFSGKTKEEMLIIMRDSRIGAFGALSLISVLLLKIALLSSLKTSLSLSFILICVLSRWSAVVSIFLFPYARAEGKARVFTEGINLKILILSTFISFVCAFSTFRIQGLLILLIIGGFIYLSGKFISKRIGGITGDTLGATIELAEVGVLFCLCLTRG
ncbi:MAG: adenosylcobinamide-GDP ribazoletransferase [Candidatus Omnitrophica bacterium]|nr:adenosylcobinamide-GDP ribazoletransferase [Candidatus Omnitrophota bacterium]